MSKDNIMRNSEYLRALGNAVNTEIGFSEANGKGLKSVSKFEHGMNALNQARNRVIPSPSQTINTTASGKGLNSVSKFEQMMKAMSPAGMYWDSGELVWARPNNTNGSQFVAVGAFFTKIANSTTTYLHNSVTAAENMVKVGTSVVVGNVSNAVSFISNQASNLYTVTSGKVNSAYSSIVSLGSDTWKGVSDNTISSYSYAANTVTHATNSANKTAKNAAGVSESIYSGITQVGVVSYKATLSAAVNVYSYAVSSGSAAWKYVSGSASSAYKDVSGHVQNASDKAKMIVIAAAANAGTTYSTASANVAGYYTQANTWVGSTVKSTQSKAVGSYANVAVGVAQAVKYTYSQVNHAYTVSSKGVKSVANFVASVPGNTVQFVSNDLKSMGKELSESHARRLEQRWIKTTESYLKGIKKIPPNAPVIWGHQNNNGTSSYQVLSPGYGLRTFEGNLGTIVYIPSNNESIISEKGRQPSTIASAYDAAKAAVSAVPGFFSKVQASVAASVTKTIKGVSSTLEEVAKANMMPFPPDSTTAEKQPQLKAVPPKVSEADSTRPVIEALRSSIPIMLPNGRFNTRRDRKDAERIGTQIRILEAGLAKTDALSSAARRSAESAVRKPQRLRA